MTLDFRRHSADAIAIVTGDTTLTYADLWRHVDAARERFATLVGSEPACIGIVAHRSVETIAALLACIEARLPVALFHARLTSSELAGQIAFIQPAVLVDDDNWTPRPDTRTEWLAPFRGLPAEEQPLVILFTSGTGGTPKAAILSHRAITAAVRAYEEHLGWRESDRWLLGMPLAHVSGLAIVTRCLSAGRSIAILPEGAFNARDYLQAVTEHEVTIISVVPTMLHRLLEARLPCPRAVRMVLCGGAAVSAPLLAAAEALAYPVFATYGLTETGSQAATERQPSQGLVAIPGVSLRVIQGQIELKGDVLFSGYLGSSSVLPTEWWRTGDLGELDDQGKLRVRGRGDDVIITGGENVSPTDVEVVLLAMPGVRQVCVFGVPDEEWGERVAAVVVGTVDATAITLHAERHLAPHSRPRLWCNVDALPTSANGKVDRRTVRALTARHLLPVTGSGRA